MSASLHPEMAWLWCLCSHSRFCMTCADTVAFSGLATWSIIFRACVFTPYDLVRHFQVLHFQVLHFQSPRTHVLAMHDRMNVSVPVLFSIPVYIL